MKTFNMHEAKTHLSRLVEAAAAGESFVIARAGKPLVKVMRLDADQPRRLGFMQGQFQIPEDFDSMGADQIRAMFEGGTAGGAGQGA